MNNILDKLGRIRIIPVAVINDAAHATPLAEALLQGGLPTMEVTFRTRAAHAALQRIATSCPGMLLGAGTVLTIDQVKQAVDAGATYIVSPGLSRQVVEHCLWNNIAVIPGAVTPTEVTAALEFGLDVLKFFPAEASGGVSYLKAIGAPFERVKFIPTGGIDPSNILSYLNLPQVFACGGSWMVKNEMIAAGKFDEIKALTDEAVKLRDSLI